MLVLLRPYLSEELIQTSQTRFIAVCLHVWIMYYSSLCVAQTCGWTAIFFAVEEGNLEIIELLIKGGAKLDIKDNVRWCTDLLYEPVYIAIKGYSPLLVEWSDSV